MTEDVKGEVKAASCRKLDPGEGLDKTPLLCAINTEEQEVQGFPPRGLQYPLAHSPHPLETFVRMSGPVCRVELLGQLVHSETGGNKMARISG